MNFYIGFALLMFIPILMQRVKIYLISSQTLKKSALLFACGMIFVVMACRSGNVGADTRNYLAAFSQIKDISLKEIFTIEIYNWSESYTYSLEPGYRLYNKAVGFFFESKQVITVFNSLIIVVLLYKLIRKKSPYYLMSVWLYITLGIFQTEMNMARNAIAILICLNATNYIDEHNIFKYFFNILIASTFHMSSIIFVPVYWLAKDVKLTEKKMKVALVLSLLAGIILPIINPILIDIVPQRYVKYLTVRSDKTEGLILAVLFLGLFIFLWIFSDHGKKKYDNAEYNNVGNWMFILMMGAFSFSYAINSLTRVAALFSPYLIIYFLRMIHYGIADQRKKRFLLAALFVLCFVQYILRLSINNIGGTVPYEFFWEG